MKKVILLIITVVTVSSCSLFQKPSMNQEQINALVNEKARVEENLINLNQKYELLKIQAEECASMLEEQTQAASSTGKYAVVVGSFKENGYATKYVEKIKQMGGTGAIVYGPSDFKFVTYSSHPTLAEAVQQMEVTRANVEAMAWIYMER